MKQNSERKRLKAYHEAAHTAMMIHEGFKVSHVSIKPRAASAGNARFDEDFAGLVGWVKRGPRGMLDSAVLILLAGTVAEMLIERKSRRAVHDYCELLLSAAYDRSGKFKRTDWGKIRDMVATFPFDLGTPKEDYICERIQTCIKTLAGPEVRAVVRALAAGLLEHETLNREQIMRIRRRAIIKSRK